MHDREFEKQVQQKMEELRFPPGADVWARVQADIRRKKRRRPIIFLLLLAGLIAGSAGLYYTLDGKGKQQSATAVPDKASGNQNETPSSETADPAGTQQEKGDQTDNNKSIKEQQDNTDKEITGSNDKTSTVKNTAPAGNTRVNVTDNNGNRDDDNKNVSADKLVAKRSIDRSSIDKKNVDKTNIDKRITDNRIVGKKTTIANTDAGKINPTAKDKQDVANDVVKNKGTENKIAKDNARQDPQNDDPSTAKSIPQQGNVADSLVQQKPLTADSTTIKPVDKPAKALQPAGKPADSVVMKPFGAKKSNSKKSDWQWGVQGGVGVSDLAEQFLKATAVADFASGGPGVSAPPRDSAATVKFRPSGQLGVYVSKGISSRLRLKLGLNYEYYANSIHVGWYVSSPRFVNQAGGALNRVDEYYTSSGNYNTYTNTYHFLSLPASVQWKLNRNKKYGLIWENGIAVSRLLTADALHYDGISKSYYKDNTVYRKTQFTASSSFLFSFSTKSNKQFYAGPHVQYSLSNLVRAEGMDKHLRYAGIKLMMGFNK